MCARWPAGQREAPARPHARREDAGLRRRAQRTHRRLHQTGVRSLLPLYIYSFTYTLSLSLNRNLIYTLQTLLVQLSVGGLG